MNLALPQGHKRVHIIESKSGIFCFKREKELLKSSGVYLTSQEGEEASTFQREQSKASGSAWKT